MTDGETRFGTYLVQAYNPQTGEYWDSTMDTPRPEWVPGGDE